MREIVDLLLILLNALPTGLALVGAYVVADRLGKRAARWWYGPPPPTENRIRMTARGIVAARGVGVAHIMMRPGLPLVVEIDADVMENCHRAGGALHFEIGPEYLPQPVGRIEQLQRERAGLLQGGHGVKPVLFELRDRDRIAAIDAELARLGQSLN
jgi:hypothetical protein